MQEGGRGTVLFMYVMEACVFFWNFGEDVDVLKSSLLRVSGSVFIDWGLAEYWNLYTVIFGMQISHLRCNKSDRFGIREVDGVEEGRRGGSYLSFLVTWMWSGFPMASAVQMAGCRVCYWLLKLVCVLSFIFKKIKKKKKMYNIFNEIELQNLCNKHWKLLKNT